MLFPPPTSEQEEKTEGSGILSVWLLWIPAKWEVSRQNTFFSKYFYRFSWCAEQRKTFWSYVGAQPIKWVVFRWKWLEWKTLSSVEEGRLEVEKLLER